MFKVKMDGNEPYMETLTDEQVKKEQKRTQTVSVKLSKNVIRQMKRAAGIKNDTSDNAVLYAFITKSLQDAKI